LAPTLTEETMTSGIHTPRPTPRRPEWAAHAIPLCVLPSSLWRLGALFVPGDWYATRLTVPAAFSLVFLSVFSEALALLAFGLVRPWGEVVPGWIPLLGGRRVPPSSPRRSARSRSSGSTATSCSTPRT